MSFEVGGLAAFCGARGAGVLAGDRGARGARMRAPPPALRIMGRDRDFLSRVR